MKIWGYDQVQGTFRMYYAEDWMNEITVDGAVKYINEQLKKSVIDDFDTAYQAYIKNNTGFFGSLRLLFPIITFLGTLLNGSDNSGNAVDFIRRYLGQVNKEYQNVGDVLYAIYRHGLAHTNMPKIISVDGHDVGWVISFGNEPHLTLTKRGLKEYNIWIRPHQLYSDIIKAIDLYIEDFKNSQNEVFLNNFKSGYLEMAKYHRKEDVSRSSRQGFEYLSRKIQDIQDSY